MPIQLTTAISGGDFEPGMLTHAKIMQFTMSPNVQKISLRVHLGGLVAGVFQSAAFPHVGTTVRDHEIEGQEYNTIIAATASAQGANLYDEVSSALYQWLLDKGHFVGTIV